MKKSLLIIFLIILQFSLFAQDTTWSSNWSVEYVTSDSRDSLNSIGYNTISVAVVEEDAFVALVNTEGNNAHYLVGYRNTTKNGGRLGNIDYAPAGKQTKWIKDFDQEIVFDANDLAAEGNLIYLANNDEVNHSILMFELMEDSLYTHPQRYSVKEYIWGIDVDANGRVYVTKTGDSLNAGSVLILEDPDASPAWTTMGNSGTVLQEFQLPEIGEPRGITVNSDGSIIYVSNYDENKVYCYIGDPINGYSLYEGFNFSVDSQFEAPGGTLDVGPFGLQLMPDKNLLFVCHDANFVLGGDNGYTYGRIYMCDPNTGEVLDTVNTSEWNFFIEGQYDNHNPQNNASGYTSTYAVDFDENLNLYTQSYFGWTVDKWVYDGELPTVEITIVSVEKIDELIPERISLSQNYPNPFNPTTTIEFTVNKIEDVSLKIYSITGELVADLINASDLSPGAYEVTFDAGRLASGTYIYKLTSGNNSISKKMTLLK